MNKRKKVICGCVLLILGVFLVASGFLYQKLKKPSVSKKELTITEEQKQTESNKYYSAIEEAIIYSDSYLIEQYPIKDFNKLTAQTKTLFLLNILSSKQSTKLTTENLEKIKEDWFKENTKLTFETITNNKKENLYSYDSNKKEFTREKSSINRTYLMQSKTISSRIEIDKWISKKKVYYEDMTITGQEYPKNIYKSIADAQKKQNEIFTEIDANHQFTEEEYEKVKDKLETITYTLIKENKKYKLQSIEQE